MFSTPDDDFALILPDGTEIAFIEGIEQRPNVELVFEQKIPGPLEPLKHAAVDPHYS